MTETYLQSKLMNACRVTMPHSVVLNHHGSRFTKDYPDMTVSWLDTTSWWELKLYDNEAFDTPEAQSIMCRKLAQQSICNYIIYEERKGVKRTLIVHPGQMDAWSICTNFAHGFSHVWVAAYIRKTHEHHRQERHL